MDATLFMVAASLLSVFNITNARDEHGHEIPVKDAMPIDNVVVV